MITLYTNKQKQVCVQVNELHDETFNAMKGFNATKQMFDKLFVSVDDIQNDYDATEPDTIHNQFEQILQQVNDDTKEIVVVIREYRNNDDDIIHLAYVEIAEANIQDAIEVINNNVPFKEFTNRDSWEHYARSRGTEELEYTFEQIRRVFDVQLEIEIAKIYAQNLANGEVFSVKAN